MKMPSGIVWGIVVGVVSTLIADYLKDRVLKK